MKKEEVRVTCPNCGEQIPVDEKAYHKIVNEVCNEEVNRRVQDIKAEMDQVYSEKAEVIKAQAENEYQTELEKTRRHFVELREKSNAQISALQAKLDVAEKDKSIAVNDAVKDSNDVINNLNAVNGKLADQIEFMKTTTEQEKATLRATLENQYKDQLIALAEEKDAVINGLRSDINVLSAENEFKDDQIASLKDFKSKLSTKLLGESLEKHCEIAYDRNLKPVIKNASFSKDTGAGEKGDYIYREVDEDRNEMLSILFEMKNEDDFSDSKKKKNRDFFDKLDKDRIRRKCSVAVLVTTLEPDNEIYNSGITCVTDYPKMYVVRPQNFIDFIHLMRALAEDRRSLALELEAEKSKSIDIAAFEADLEEYKESLVKNTTLAKKHSDDVIKQIDRFIIALEKHKEKVIAWQMQCELADKKAKRLSLKSLAKGNATVSGLIDCDGHTPGADGEMAVTDVDDSEITVVSNDDNAA